jgi:hypothetical protein
VLINVKQDHCFETLTIQNDLLGETDPRD